MSSRKLLSVVCPVYNEELSVPLFYERLQTALKTVRESYDVELLFTNNRSSDGTRDIILDLRRKDTSVSLITLSRNFGYQASVMAGLRHASGDAVVVIDVDCEDPPEMIPTFVEGWESGFDIVYGARVQRSELKAVHLMRLAFYRLNRLVADSDIILDMAEFALISARVRDLILANESTYPFLRTETGYVGFSRKGIPYKRQHRLRGKTHYNFLGMIEFAIGGILSSSTFPLRFAAYLAPPVCLVCAVLLYLDLIQGLSKCLDLLIGVALIYLVTFMACISIYLARVYKNGVGRPIYIVDWDQSAWTPFSRESALDAMWTTNRSH